MCHNPDHNKKLSLYILLSYLYPCLNSLPHWYSKNNFKLEIFIKTLYFILRFWIRDTKKNINM